MISHREAWKKMLIFGFFPHSEASKQFQLDSLWFAFASPVLFLYIV